MLTSQSAKSKVTFKVDRNLIVNPLLKLMVYHLVSSGLDNAGLSSNSSWVTIMVY